MSFLCAFWEFWTYPLGYWRLVEGFGQRFGDYWGKGGTSFSVCSFGRCIGTVTVFILWFENLFTNAVHGKLFQMFQFQKHFDQ